MQTGITRDDGHELFGLARAAASASLSPSRIPGGARSGLNVSAPAEPLPAPAGGGCRGEASALEVVEMAESAAAAAISCCTRGSTGRGEGVFNYAH